MKTLLYCLLGLSIMLPACAVKKTFQHSYGGDFKIVQHGKPERAVQKATQETMIQTDTVQTVMVTVPNHEAGLDEKAQISRSRTSLKQKLKAASAAKKMRTTLKKKNAPSSEEDWFAAIMLITIIVALVAVVWGLIAIGVSVLGVILILVFLLGFSVFVASL